MGLYNSKDFFDGITCRVTYLGGGGEEGAYTRLIIKLAI